MQVVPDFTSEITFTDDENIRNEWIELARSHLLGAGGTKETNKKRVWYRKKTYRWVLATDTMLQNMLGKGWLSWRVPDPAENEVGSVAPLAHRFNPVITVTMDQGGDGWAGAHFMQQKLRVNLLLIGDFSHRVWNDVELALHHSALWRICLLAIVMLNADHGPWGNAKWWEEAQSGVQEYLRVASTSCPLFQTHLPNICHERSEPELQFQENRVADLFASLPDAVSRKFPKVGMSRWFQFFDAMEPFLAVWSQRLLIYQFLCIHLDLWKGGSVHALKIPLRKGVDEELEKTTTSDDREAVRKLRKSCRNTLEFVTCLLADRFFWSLNKGLCAILRPLRIWFGQTNKQNRSSKESLQFFVAMSVGHSVKPLQEMWQILHSRALAQDVGLHVNRAPAGVGPINEDHPLVQEETALLEKLCTFTREVVHKRCKSDSWHQVGVPGSFPGFLHDIHGADKVEQFRVTVDAWKVAQQKDDRFWKKVCERSSMKLQLVKDVAAELEAHRWKPSEALCNHLRQCFMGLTQTKIVEDGFREARRSEVAKNWSKTVQTIRLWHTCASSHLGDKVHRFTCPSWEDQVVSASMQKERLPDLFSKQVRETPAEFKKVLGTSRQTEWHSPGPAMAVQAREDIVLMRWAARKDARWAQASLSWLSVLALPGLILRNKNVASGGWCLSCGTGSGAVVWSWPVEEQTIHGKTFWRAKHDDIPVYLVIVALEEWEAFAIRVCGPLKTYARTGQWGEGGLLFEAVSAPQPLLTVCALQGFGTMPRQALRGVGTHIGCHVNATASLPEMIVGLVRHLCPKIGDAELLEILRKRLPQEDDLSDYLQTEEVTDLLEKGDVEILKTHKDTEASSSGDISALQKEVKDLVKKVAARGGGGMSGGSRKRKADEGPAFGGRKYPSKVKMPVAAWSVSDVLELLPPTATICCDHNNQRWLVSFFGERRSRSFQLYGFNEAAWECIRLAWDAWVQKGMGPPCPFEMAR